jgi:hypothetical protein
MEPRAKLVTYLVCALALLSGLGVVLAGTSAIHQILAAVYFLASAVAIGLAALLDQRWD